MGQYIYTIYLCCPLTLNFDIIMVDGAECIENSLPSFSLNCSIPEGAESGQQNDAELTLSQVQPDDGITKSTSPLVQPGTAIPPSVAEYDRYPQKTVRLLEKPVKIGSRTKTHICMECVTVVQKRNTRKSNDWHKALRSGTNVSNMWKHIETHETILFFSDCTYNERTLENRYNRPA